MFSQSSIDAMSIEELAKLIRSVTYTIENHADDPEYAYDYSMSLRCLADSLHDKIEELVV